MVTDTGTLTTIVLALIAIFAMLTVIGVLWGARLRRQRVSVERVEERREEIPVQVTPAPAPSPAPVAPPPAREPDLFEEPAPLADEPIAAAAPLEASPAVEAASVPTAPTAPEGPSPADGPITQLKGLGPKLAERLAEFGITTVGQLAALDASEAEALDARLGAFTGRMNRDRWLEQARFLAAGDRAGFEAVFGKL